MTGRFIGLRLARHRRGAEGHHRAFRQFRGGEQIASAFAIAVTMALLERLKPTRILEVGSGIGTLTSVLTSAGGPVYWVEDNEFCIAEMCWHLSSKERLGLIRGLGYLNDLVVVDGDQIKPGTALGVLKYRGWMLVEGNRRAWREGLRGPRPFAEVNLRPFDRSKGVWLLAFEPTLSLRVRFGLERLWQTGLSVLARAWSVLSGTPTYHGKRRPVNV